MALAALTGAKLKTAMPCEVQFRGKSFHRPPTNETASGGSAACAAATADGRYRVGRQQASFEASSPVFPPDAVIEFLAPCDVDSPRTFQTSPADTASSGERNELALRFPGIFNLATGAGTSDSRESASGVQKMGTRSRVRAS